MATTQWVVWALEKVGRCKEEKALLSPLLPRPVETHSTPVATPVLKCSPRCVHMRTSTLGCLYIVHALTCMQ